MFNKIAAALTGPKKSPAAPSTLANRAATLLETLQDPRKAASSQKLAKALSKELAAVRPANLAAFAQARPILDKVLQASKGDATYEHLRVATGNCDQRMVPAVLENIPRQDKALARAFKAMLTSPDPAARSAIIEVTHGRCVPDSFATARPAPAPVGPTLRPAPAAIGSWLDSLTPGTILNGAFDANEPSMSGLSTQVRRE